MEQKSELPVFIRIWTRVEENRKQIAWGAGIVIVVGCVAAFYFWNQEQTVVKASEALSAVEAQGAFGGPRDKSPEAYLKVAAEHSGTAAGSRALLQAAVTSFTQGKYAEAQAQFDKLNREYTENPFRAQAMLGAAASLDAQAKPDDAARVYKEVVDRYPNDTVVPQAKFGLARIYESQGKLQQAQAFYEELARGDVNSSIGNEAGLKADELRAKLPAPKPAAPASAPLLTLPPAGSTNKPSL
jgi:TolA-binding protein